MGPQPARAIKVFCSYAHEDERLRARLVMHLANLRRQNRITEWYDREISAGREWNEEVKMHLNDANLLLLLISPAFMDSHYCNNIEVTRAMERHAAKEARVIPIILRPVDWQDAPFSQLQVLPTNGRAVTLWSNRDKAWLEITNGIRRAIDELLCPAAGPRRPFELLLPKVGFVERHDKDGRKIVERLKEELSPQKKQLVVLWGAIGVGKSTIAAVAVDQLCNVFPGSVVWIAVHRQMNFSLSAMLDIIAKQLGRDDLPAHSLELKKEKIREIVSRTATLIALDGFDEVEVAEYEACREWLADAPCSVLIVTGEKVDSACHIAVEEMTQDEARELLKRFIEDEEE